MQIQDIDKVIPRLDRSKLTAGQFTFAAGQVALMRKTIESLYYGLCAGHDDFWRGHEDCSLDDKFDSLGDSLRTLFRSRDLMHGAIEQLRQSANAILPSDQQIEPLVLADHGTVEFQPDGSFLSYTAPPAPILPEPVVFPEL